MQLSLEAFLGSFPWKLSLEAFLGSFPWKLSLEAFLGSFPWKLPLPRRYTVCSACFFHDVIGLPQTEMVGFPRMSHELRLLVRRFSRLQVFLNVLASKFARPQTVPTAANTAAGQPGLLHPGLSCFVTSTRTGYANRPDTGNGRYRDSHPVRLSALSAARAPGVLQGTRRWAGQTPG